MKHIIDIDAWERRDNYGFFRSFVNSWYSVTTEIDCTEASAAARAAALASVQSISVVTEYQEFTKLRKKP